MTRTLTVTATPTVTATSSRTLTRTGTATRTFTPTHTATRTSSATPTPTTPPPTIGPTVTYFGVAEANGVAATPIGFTSDQVPIFRRTVPQGFLIVVEGKPGPSNRLVGISTFNWNPMDANALPDLQIVSSRPLGDGSAEVCDFMSATIGGVPAVDPPRFFGTQQIADRVNDLACRFEGRRSVTEACTVQQGSGDPRFLGSGSTVQFCTSPGVGAEIAFPPGDTRLTVRLRDVGGYPGNPASIVIRVQN